MSDSGVESSLPWLGMRHPSMLCQGDLVLSDGTLLETVCINCDDGSSIAILEIYGREVEKHYKLYVDN